MRAPSLNPNLAAARTRAMMGALCALFLLSGCAAFKSPLYNNKSTKCQVLDTTESISVEEHALVFEAVIAAGASFPACPDSSGDGAWAYDARVRPLKTNIPSPALSYTAIGVNTALWTAGGGLAFAYEAPLWLLLPNWSISPQAGITYRMDYLDAKGRPRHSDFSVGGEAWFKTREEAKAVALESAPSRLAFFLYGIQPPAPRYPKSFGRASLDVGPLIFARSNQGVWLDAHFEKFLPYRLSIDVSPAAFLPFSIDDRLYTIQAGPRWYPFVAAHRGLYLGVEPYAETRSYYGETFNRYALPVMLGYVSQPKRFVVGIDVGVGPSTTAGGAYDDVLVLGSFYMGWGF